MNVDEKFGGNYISTSMLPNKDIEVEIYNVVEEDVGQGFNKTKRVVLYFVGKDNGLVLNKTNATTLKTLFKSSDTEDWRGKKITLYKEKVWFQGQQVDGIRIKGAIKQGKLSQGDKEKEDKDIPF